MTPDSGGEQYIGRTLRTAAIVAVFVLMVLASYGLNWALVPYLTGFGLGILLLVLMEKFIRHVFRPERVGSGGGEAGKVERKRVGTAWFLGFAVIKYPLIAVLLYFLVRVWNTYQLMVFAGGFLTLHLIMGMRAMGKALTASSPKS